MADLELTFARAPLTWDINGDTTEEEIEYEVTAVYVSDLAVAFQREITLSTDGAHFLTYTWELDDPGPDPPPPLEIKWKYTRDGSDRHLYSWYEGSGWVETLEEPTSDTLPLTNGLVLIDLYAGLPVQTIGNYLGTYVVNEDIGYDSDPEGEDPSHVASNLVGYYDLRALVFPELKAERRNLNIMSDRQTIEVSGDVLALPVSTDLHPGGWMPYGDVDWRVYFQHVDQTGVVFVEFSDSFTPSYDSGKVGEVSLTWDGKDGDGNYLFVNAAITGTALGPTPNEAVSAALGSTPTGDPRDQCACGPCCPCGNVNYMGCLKQHFAFTLLSPPAGPPMTIPFSYTSQEMDRSPASFGFGWHSTGSARIFEDLSGGLVYRSEDGSFARWTLEEATYEPFLFPNYIEVAKDEENEDATFVLTFKNQSRREFDSAGRLRRDIDRNEVAVVYTYDGALLSTVTDTWGRTLYYDYGEREDGQPISIRALDAETGRQLQLEYYDDEDLVSPNRLKKITDPAGETTEFVYDEAGRLTEVKDTRGVTAATYTYDNFDRIETETSYGELQMEYSYSLYTSIMHDLEVFDGVSIAQTDLNDLETVRYRDMMFDKLGNLMQTDVQVGEDGFTIGYYYDDENDPHLMTAMIDPNGVTAYTYNSAGNVASIQDNLENITLLSYCDEDPGDTNPKHRNLVASVSRPEIVVDGDPVSYSSSFEYDENGNLSKHTDFAGEISQFEYNEFGQLTRYYDRHWGSEETLDPTTSTEFTYDEVTGNLLEIIPPQGPGETPYRKTVFTYDDYDNVESVDDFYGNVWQYEYDEDDRILHATDARGKETFYSYVDGRLDDVEAPANQGSGEASRHSSFTYDDPGRLTEIEREIPDPEEPESVITTKRVRFSYDAFSNLHQLQRGLANPMAPESTTTYTYDELGRNLSVVDPLARQTSMTYAPFCGQRVQTTARLVQREYNFNTLCQLSEVNIAKNRDTNPEEKHELEYDALGRLVKITQTHSARYQQGRFGEARYAQSSELRLFEYDPNDRLTKITFVDNFPDYEEDPEDPANSKVIEYGYDQEGNLTSMTDIEGNVTRYEYYYDNRLQKVIIERPEEDDRVFEYLYDGSGRLERIVFPEDSLLEARFDDGATPTPNPGWNANGQLTHLRYLKDGEHLQSFEYEYDDSGNRTALISTPLDSENTVRWEYGYDWLDRLVEVKKGVGEEPEPVTVALYAYDDRDNRIRLELPLDDAVHTYEYDEADQIFNRSVAIGAGEAELAEEFDHNEDGLMTVRTNAVTEATTTYIWNSSDRLVKLKKAPENESSTNVYDSGGIRKRHQGTDAVRTASYYSGLPAVNETNSSNDAFSYILGHQVLGFQKNSDYFYFITDGLSSVRLVVDEEGEVVASYDADEFGNPTVVDEGGVSTPARYVGGLGYRDEVAETGLYYLRQRYYDASLGRFLSRDPLGPGGGLNPYAYCDNQPIDCVDPEGAEAYIVFKNGSFLMTKDPDVFASALQHAGKGQIDRIIIRGHGAEDSSGCGFDTYSDTALGLSYDPNLAGAGVRVQAKHAPLLAKILAEKFDPNGSRRIELRACFTADSGPNGRFGLAQELARELPGVTVTGVSGDLTEHRISHYERPLSGPEGWRKFSYPAISPGFVGPMAPGVYNPFPGR